jgi:predicted AAA+ superfamily ATPase
VIPRQLSDKILQWAGQYPVVTITGPRQSGKSTLCKALFPNKAYISLEDAPERLQASEDPRGFLARFPDGAVFDEIQRVPGLTSAIQTLVDKTGKPGMFILTGSQQFELMAGVSQSLAGRTALARLLPFSYQEIYGGKNPPELNTLLHKGFYPAIHDRNLDPSEAMSFYFSTYVERDLRQIVNVRDLGKFELFMKLLAGRSGQLLNASSLAADCGISHGTAAGWINILEQSALIHLLRPFYRNWGKRLIKAPKVYFLDTGLQCWLLNIFSPGQLENHPLRGQVFETFVLSDMIKNRYNRGKPDIFTFYRDQKGVEVDLVAEVHPVPHLYEIKSSATLHTDFLATLIKLEASLGLPAAKTLILGNTDPLYHFKGARIAGYGELASVDPEVAPPS